MKASDTNYFAKVRFTTATHEPVIRLFIDGNLVQPYVVKDVGAERPFFLSRHKSDLAARRALSRYRRMIKQLGI